MTQKTSKILVIGIFIFFGFAINAVAQTIALWLFDEPIAVYPSTVLSDNGTNDYPMVIGSGGQIVQGQFGNALAPIEYPDRDIVIERLQQQAALLKQDEGILFGLKTLPIPDGRTVAPMSWINANFCALMTSGENHLRKEVGFVHPTKTKLNLGAFDWTVEFWFLPTQQSNEEGVVFEIGQGPRGENDVVTKLILNADQTSFAVINQPSQTKIHIPSDKKALNSHSKAWHHFAFVYSVEAQQLSHFVDGKRQPLPERCQLNSLDYGKEDYFTVGRDGNWQHPLQGRIDELRFSLGKVYQKNFTPPGSYADLQPKITLKAGLPLLFADKKLTVTSEVTVSYLPLEDRKYLFIDDAIVEKTENINFTVNPPHVAECVIDSIDGPFRKHVSIIEDEDGLIRMYYGGPDDWLEVRTSRDGVHWDIPALVPEYKGRRNYAITEPTAMGNVFLDPNAPPEARWRFVSDYDRRGIFLYSSPDGWSFKRHKTAILPARSGSQSNVFYDDQRQLYVGYHRSDLGATPSGRSQRMFNLTETSEITKPWPFKPISLEAELELAKKIHLRQPHPHYLDNGPLTPSGFGVEYPIAFAHDDAIDPLATDIYVPKALKYPWAHDAYLAFPLLYFHYEDDGPITRQILYHPDRKTGSGTVETQVAVSRDGVHWQRYPRPAYIGIGKYGNHYLPQIYLAHGLVKRGDEIWQYFFGETRYHSSWQKQGENIRAVYRTVQRFDGFISADAPYEKEGVMITKPLKFKGNRLVLNIATDAAGYAQVGFLDEIGKPIKGFTVDDCIYINGDFIETEVEWIKNQEVLPPIQGLSDKELFFEAMKLKFSKDLSELEGKTVQVVFRMRGAKLYSMQFVKK
ncbi:hypothetical protein L0Z72_04460 [candidate division KSB1 bacterium]|nr:hypothetical protein [candidate division KSB1 bacterium]